MVYIFVLYMVYTFVLNVVYTFVLIKYGVHICVKYGVHIWECVVQSITCVNEIPGNSSLQRHRQPGRTGRWYKCIDVKASCVCVNLCVHNSNSGIVLFCLCNSIM